MPGMDDFGATPRKALPIFYLLDTSGSMYGTPIGTLNSAMGETMEALKDLAKSNADAQLKIGVLEFNSSVRWKNPGGLQDVEDFFYEDLEAGEMTCMGDALKELNSKLSRHAFLDSIAGNLMPIIIVMSDGYANDEYLKPLEEIKKNRWFKRATKIGFAIGDDADLEMLAKIVGDSEAVIKTTDMSMFSKMIKFVSVTSSMLVSTSSTSETAPSAADIVAQAKTEVDGGSDVQTAGDQGVYVEPDPVEDDEDGWGDDWE